MYEPAVDTAYTVWASVLSGPRRMTRISAEGDDGRRWHSGARKCLSFGTYGSQDGHERGPKWCRVYFDRIRHQEEREDTTYVFFHILEGSNIINICAVHNT